MLSSADHPIHRIPEECPQHFRAPLAAYWTQGPGISGIGNGWKGLFMTIAVTGGAGYIGAHVVRLLAERGDDVLVIDDLSTGRRERIGRARLLQLEISAPEAPALMAAAMRESGTTAVIHFAAKKQVGESMANPALYYQHNLTGMLNVLSAMQTARVDKLVYSSSAATYGMPDVDMVTETTTPRPINPYGETKLVGEWIMADYARAYGLRGAALRYFNVAGAGWNDLGDPAILNLIPMVFAKLESGERPRVFGDDYPTPDGTCIRDYVHVLDLAEAHLAALAYLDRADRPFLEFNVGTGKGSSVREVIAEIGLVSGLDTTPKIEPRRPGDPPRLIADVSRIKEMMDWTASYDLPSIVSSSWAAWRAVRD